MSKTISKKYQAKKQKLKNLFALKPEDRKSFLFEKENPDFPAQLIPDRLKIGLFSISYIDLSTLPIEGSILSIERPTFGIIG